ncbi:MAG: carbohydrate kinase [Bacteroidales bacterium]|nr:carbohydrate kinase [Bacteroidales bacterium]MCF8403435.1 carbohydrate kinase [Bacteroidales bacterium]
MKHKRIFAIGETIYDILFKDGQPLGGTAGGAMLNTAVSLGRMKLPIHLISEIGKDDIGNSIIDFLNGNDVGTRYVYRFKEGSSAIAIAFLDENDDASYTFYKNYPAKRLNARFPEIKENDLVLFGSFFSITKEIRRPLLKFLRNAKKAGAIIIYDPNFRKPHIKDLPLVKKYILENIDLADIVRGSGEDFKLIFGLNSSKEVCGKIFADPKKILIYTNGPKKVHFNSKYLEFTSKVPQITTLSTVGAGDNFNAGIIYSLTKLNIGQSDLHTLRRSEWEAIIDTAITFGTIVCESYENYISKEFAAKITDKNGKKKAKNNF